MSTLGYGEHQLLFTDRLGQRVAAVSDRQCTDTSWGRELSEVSQAQATIGDPPSALRNLEPWYHHLTVYRDGAIVWRGAVFTTSATSSQISLTARDPATYFDRRRIGNQRTWFQRDLSEVAADLIRDAMRVDDPFRLADGMVVEPTGIFVTRNVQADARMVAEELKDLVAAGLTWTVVGGRLLVGPVAAKHTTAPLTDRDVDGGFAVVKDGSDTLTDAVVLGKGVQARWFDNGSPLGVLQDIDKQDAVSQEYAAINAARRLVKDRRVTPRRVTLPSATRLAATAAMGMDELVCGAMMPVQTTATGVEVNSTMVLTAVKVTVKAATDDVSVALADPPAPLEVQELTPPPHGFTVSDKSGTYTTKDKG